MLLDTGTFDVVNLPSLLAVSIKTHKQLVFDFSKDSRCLLDSRLSCGQVALNMTPSRGDLSQ